MKHPGLSQEKRDKLAQVWRELRRNHRQVLLSAQVRHEMLRMRREIERTTASLRADRDEALQAAASNILHAWQEKQRRTGL